MMQQSVNKVVASTRIVSSRADTESIYQKQLGSRLNLGKMTGFFPDLH